MPQLPLFRTVLFLAVFVIGCSTDSVRNLHMSITPVNSNNPRFNDDLGLQGLSLAILRQLSVLRKEDDREILRIGQVSYRTNRLIATLERFNQLLSETDACLNSGESPTQCNDLLSQKIHDQFIIYRLDHAQFTAYYTPIVEVSKQPDEKFRYPIYRTPNTRWERDLSRDEIDFLGKLDGKGYELFYAADRFDIYIMHIEGGAKVIVNDNGQRYTKYLHYDADNDLEFTDIDEYMMNHGLLESNRRSRLDQRAVLSAHPNRVREIFAICPGYVFFKVSDIPSIGSTGSQLTENRSMATDPSYYPVKGMITYVVAPLPMPPAEGTPTESNPSVIQYRAMQRFFIDQDIGHHILGPARADLFFGEGPYAEFLSNNLMSRGTIYLLLLK